MSKRDEDDPNTVFVAPAAKRDSKTYHTSKKCHNSPESYSTRSRAILEDWGWEICDICSDRYE